jgi:hypothetical protein
MAAKRMANLMANSAITGWVVMIFAVGSPTANAQLNDSCTISVLNRNVQVNTDGTWVLPNIPVNQGRVRARATCILNGLTKFGQSDLFTVPVNDSLTLQPIIFGSISPIPQLLTVTPSVASITTLGATSQMMTVATYPDGTSANVSAAAAGTNYTSSDTTVATVSADGVVQAVSNGTVFITAFNEGTSGAAAVQVGIPPQISITSPAAGATVTQGATIPVTAQVTGGATVASVSFTVNGRIEYTAVASPFIFSFTVPTGVASITLGATVQDVTGATATAQAVVIMAIPDVGTTVTGSVVDPSNNAVSGATVNCLGVTGTTSASGVFSIANVPTARGNIVCFATDVINGVTLTGSSSSAVPVKAGTTNVGQIVLTALSSRGTDFWLGFPYDFEENGGQLIILTETSANYTVTGTGLNVTGTATAQTPAIVAIPQSLADYSWDSAVPYGIHLTSDADVTAIFFYPGTYEAGTYLAIPTALLGTEYFAVTSTYIPQLEILGTQNNTTVTLTPTCASILGDIAANQTVSVTLNQGDTYAYVCDALTDDLTGSHVLSNKPVGVIAGNYFTYNANGTSFSAFEQMMFPVSSLYSTDFYSAPVSTTGADLVRIIAAQNGTNVRVDDGVSPTTYTLNSGQFKEIAAPRANHYTSDKPISVVQFGLSPYQTIYGNSFEMEIVPTGGFTTTSRLYSPSGFNFGNFATIIAPTAAAGSVTLNGTPVTGFTALPGGAYSYVTVAIPVGQSVVTASQPVGVYATGFATYGSYGNPTSF